jgi:hypothetical protein
MRLPHARPMPWVEVFAVFVVSHLVGDYLLQTEWQAQNKRGGLGGAPESRHALLAHIATYTLAFSPSLILLSDDLGWGALGIAALIAVPHLIQDDGRPIEAYVKRLKRAATPSDGLLAIVDQSFHVVALFAVAALAGA